MCIRDRSTGLANQEGLYSLMFKSVSLARMEAERGKNDHWGEPLRKCWRDGVGRRTGLEGLGPAEVYEEVNGMRKKHTGKNIISERTSFSLLLLVSIAEVSPTTALF